MFGQKLNHRNLLNTYHNVKSHLGLGYSQPKSFLGTVDNGVRFAKKAFAVLSPLIDTHLGHTSVNKHIMNGLSGYVNLKHQVVGHHDELQQYAGKLKGLF